MTLNGCCGQMGKRRARHAPPEPLPDNPKPDGGVRMIYVGSGRVEVKGAHSGLTYILADYRRPFRAHPGDVNQLLRSRDFILQP